SAKLVNSVMRTTLLSVLTCNVTFQMEWYLVLTLRLNTGFSADKESFGSPFLLGKINANNHS
ncbi:hypothetical protein ACLI1Y_15865, partial [Enterococcus faecalis]|uniref:hypothetical protein n=1 Tax=Enterococcus faecalis TaxID=1351 RepID=UPI0039851AA4